jgi:UDP-glucose 4-epimerase
VKVLITGGGGFIGERFATALVSKGATVHIIDDFSRGRDDVMLKALVEKPQVELINRNILDPNAFTRLSTDYDAIVHLAAILGVQNVLDRPYETLRDNVFMHEAVLRFARTLSGLKRILFTSTSEVYAGSLKTLNMPVPTPEDFPLVVPPFEDRRSSYMLSKIYGEAMLHQAGLPFTIVRPHNVYGPRMGMSHVVPQLLEKAHLAKSNSSIEVFSVEHRRCFCYIDDAVEMMQGCLLSERTRNVVLNLGAESPEVTMRRVAEIAIATVGKPLAITAKPPTPGSPERRAPKMTRMVEATGYVATVMLEEGVKRTYDWYRKNMFPQWVG